MKKIITLLIPAGVSLSALAEGETPTAATQMFTTATTFVQSLESPLSAMLVAAFGIVVVFVAYKLAKRAINKV